MSSTRSLATTLRSFALGSTLVIALAGTTAAQTVILDCPVIGIGGDNANFRGIRFTVDQTFDSLEFRADGSASGSYTFDAEIRRSTGFVAGLETTVSVTQTLSGTPSSNPYPATTLTFPPITVGATPETFTLKLTNISGPGALFWEVTGIGNFLCTNVEVTEQNNVASPTPRTSPGGFRVFGSVGASIGNNYCTAAANSMGVVGSISAVGSTSASANDVTLEATNLPSSQFGIFVTSMTQAFIPGAGGTSNGNLCLGGSIGRFSLPSQIQSTGAGGSFALTIDTTQIPQGSMFVTLMAGETWNYQAWHRDTVGVGIELHGRGLRSYSTDVDGPINRQRARLLSVVVRLNFG